MNFLKSVLFLLLFTSAIFGQQYIGDNKIVVEGNCDLIIESDRASFYFSVVGFGPTLREAVGSAKTKIQNATRVLYKYGVSKNSISTSTFQSEENFNGKAFLSSNKDFKTLISVYVVIDSLPNLEDIIIELTENGIESINTVEFSLKNSQKYKTEAKEKAIDDAKQKATDIAERFGAELKKIIYIEEIGFYQNYPNPFNSQGMWTPESQSKTVVLYSRPVKINQKIKAVYSIK